MNRKLVSAATFTAVLALGWFLGASREDRSAISDADRSPAPNERLAASPSPDPASARLLGKAPSRFRDDASLLGSALPSLPPVPDKTALSDPRRRALEAQRKEYFIEDVAHRKGRLYDQFASTAGLTPESFQGLIELLASREVEFLDQLVARRDENGRAQPPDREAFEAFRSETDAQVRDALSPAQFEHYQTYSEKLPERAIVEMVCAVEPAAEITETQENHLVEILYQARQSVVQSGASSHDQVAHQQGLAFNQAIEQSSSLISPAAHTALSGILNELSAPKSHANGVTVRQ